MRAKITSKTENKRDMSKKLWFCVFLIWFTGGSLFSSVMAQSGFFQEESFSFETDRLSGFSEDGRVKILLLTLVPSGMTETAAEEIGKALQLNLYNTNHFTVVGPSEWNAQIQARDPSLADCHDIACGILVGKLFNSDKVLVGKISMETILDDNAQEEQGMVLSLRLVDVVTNITTFSDEIQFMDENMHDSLFKLASRISENTLLRGHVLSVQKKEVVIDLGRAHGLKVGHQVVVFTQASATADLEGQTLEVSQKNIAVVQIHRLNDMSSEAIILQKIEDIRQGYLIKTFVNFSKQVQLIAKTRRELDTQKRLTPKTRPLELIPELVDDASGRFEWQRRLNDAEQNQERWMYSSIGAATVTFFLINGTLQIFSENLNQYLTWAALGATVYSGYQFIQFRKLVEEIKGEGRIKGFTPDITYQLSLTPEGPRFALRYSF